MKNVWPLKLIRGEKLKSYGDEARPSELSTEQITIVAVFVYFIIYRAVRIISSSQCLNFWLDDDNYSGTFCDVNK